MKRASRTTMILILVMPTLVIADEKLRIIVTTKNQGRQNDDTASIVKSYITRELRKCPDLDVTARPNKDAIPDAWIYASCSYCFSNIDDIHHVITVTYLDRRKFNKGLRAAAKKANLTEKQTLALIREAKNPDNDWLPFTWGEVITITANKEDLEGAMKKLAAGVDAELIEDTRALEKAE